MSTASLIIAIAVVGVSCTSGCRTAADNAYNSGELVEKTTADEQGWTGREVRVFGYVRTALKAEAGDGYVLSLVDGPYDATEKYVDCKISTGNAPEGLERKTVEVQGRIASVFRQNYLNMRRVKLDPCELKK